MDSKTSLYTEYTFGSPASFKSRNLASLDFTKKLEFEQVFSIYEPVEVGLEEAVLEAYGFPKDATESDIVARLFKMYQELTK